MKKLLLLLTAVLMNTLAIQASDLPFHYRRQYYTDFNGNRVSNYTNPAAVLELSLKFTPNQDEFYFTINNGEPLVSWETVKSRSGKEIVMVNSNLLEGKTDGKKIWISENYGDDKKTCIYLHERAHTILHFDENGEKIENKYEELEAESVAYITASAIGINNESSASYIKSYVKENPADEIEIRGSTIINCSIKILSELGIEI